MRDLGAVDIEKAKTGPSPVVGPALGSSRFWSIGPTVRWPIFNAGRIRANIRVQDAREQQSLAQYEKVVLTSLEDVENALVAYGREQVRRRSLKPSMRIAWRRIWRMSAIPGAWWIF